MRLAVTPCALVLVLLHSGMTLAEVDASSAEAASGSDHVAGEAWPRLRFGGGFFVGALVPLEPGDRPGPGGGVGGRIGAMFSRYLGAHYELNGLDNVIWRSGESNALLSLNNSVLVNAMFFDRLEVSAGSFLGVDPRGVQGRKVPPVSRPLRGHLVRTYRASRAALCRSWWRAERHRASLSWFSLLPGDPLQSNRCHVLGGGGLRDLVRIPRSACPACSKHDRARWPRSRVAACRGEAMRPPNQTRSEREAAGDARH